MTREFKVGDKVFDLRYGNGNVSFINEGQTHTVICRFKHGNESYTHAGKYGEHDAKPTLFHGHDLILEVKEPEYEWQVLFEREGLFEMSCYFYKSIESFYRDYEFYTAELYEPSKRLVRG